MKIILWLWVIKTGGTVVKGDRLRTTVLGNGPTPERISSTNWTQWVFKRGQEVGRAGCKNVDLIKICYT